MRQLLRILVYWLLLLESPNLGKGNYHIAESLLSFDKGYIYLTVCVRVRVCGCVW